MLYSVSSTVNDWPVSAVRPVGGEVLIDGQGVAQRDQGDQVRRNHLLVHIVLGCGGGAVDFVRLHGTEVEKQNDEPPVFERTGFDRRGCAGGLGLSLAQQRRLCRGRGQYRIRIFEIERNHLLGLVIFQYGEVFALEIANRVAVLVAHGHVHQHQFSLGTECVITRGFLGNDAAWRQQQRQNHGQCRLGPVDAIWSRSRHVRQKRNRALSCRERIAPTEITRPYVGEFTIVSIVENCGVLKTLENCARSSRKRDSLIGKILVKAISNNRWPGPSMLLRRAFPNAPDGATNAAVLNHSATEASGKLTG